MTLTKDKRGQNFLEYVVLLVVFVLVLLAMQAYIIRALAGNWRSLGDSFGFGKQYEEGVTIVTNEDGD
ncbi:MAG: hypothetical protein Q8N14_03440 [Candidatus Omnitrophota bacterium]|nr:hypothetical protein [Candidatus Omnitrophota bacterium]